MDLSIVIVSYNTLDMLRDCLRALPEATQGLAVETFVVDNASPDDSAGMVAATFPEVRLIANQGNPGFAVANNQALRQCVGRNAVILNPDTEAEAGSLATLVAYLDAHPEVGAVGPMLLNTDGTLQPNGRTFPNPWREFLGHTGLRRYFRRTATLDWDCGRSDLEVEAEVGNVSGACMMVRKSVMDRVGMLDEDFFMFYEEVEWCWRIRHAGWKIMFVPEARVVHHWMGSVRQQSRAMTVRLLKSMLVYYRKTAGFRWQMESYLVFVSGYLRNEWLNLGVRGKRLLRRARVLR